MIQTIQSSSVMPKTFVVELDDRIMVEVIKQFTTPEQIEALEGELLTLDPLFIQVKHGFAKGIYTRQVTIPRGTLAIGHAHSEECLNIVTQGSVSVVLDGEVRLIKGPCTFVSPALTRKVGYVHEDLTWITVHRTDCTSIEQIEEDMAVKSETFKRYEAKKGDRSTEIANCPRDEFWPDRLDYFRMLEEIGVTHQLARIQTENLADQIDFPGETGNSVYLASSKIQGNGIFSSFDFEPNMLIAPARIQGKRTKVGRYTNHARYPNCIFTMDDNGDIYLMSSQPINEGDELTVDYRQAREVAYKAQELLNYP